MTVVFRACDGGGYGVTVAGARRDGGGHGVTVMDSRARPAPARRRLRTAGITVMLAAALIIAGCATGPPKRPHNACSIFAEKSGWEKHTRRAARKWRVDAAVLLAIMRQESAFQANAKPRRKRFLGIPTRRPSSAFGYPQALDSTWALYRRSSGNRIAQRDRFKDAIDFIAWYVAQTRARLKVPPHDGYRNYLAYHEGWNGYARATYTRKKWLITVARRVDQQAKKYRAQLKRC